MVLIIHVFFLLIILVIFLILFNLHFLFIPSSSGFFYAFAICYFILILSLLVSFFTSVTSLFNTEINILYMDLLHTVSLRCSVLLFSFFFIIFIVFFYWLNLSYSHNFSFVFNLFWVRRMAKTNVVQVIPLKLRYASGMACWNYFEIFIFNIFFLFFFVFWKLALLLLL